MWRKVLALEWRILRRDRSALAVLFIFAAFLVLSALAGGRHAGNLADGLDAGKRAEVERLTALTERLGELEASDAAMTSKDPRDPVWMGEEGYARYVALPPAPLAAVAVGQRDLHPQAVRVTTGLQLTQERETETQMSGPTRLMTGAFDPAFLFVVLFPLVIIALSYELLSGERERGTLAMLLSQPVTQRDLVIGKAGARGVVICGVTLAFALLGLLIAGAELGSGIAWAHVGLYALILVAWAAFWFATAVWVNGWGQTSARNALSLVGFWLVLVVVIPGLVNVAVDTVYPPPSRIDLMHEAREAAQEVKGKIDGLEGRHDIDAKKGALAKRVVEAKEELVERSAPVLKELRDKLRERQAVLSNLRFLSPALVVQLALEDVAGSGMNRHHLFEDQADAYHARFRGFFKEPIQAERPLKTSDLSQVPGFTFEDEPITAMSARVAGGAGVLLLAVIGLLALAGPSLRRVGRLTR